MELSRKGWVWQEMVSLALLFLAHHRSAHILQCCVRVVHVGNAMATVHVDHKTPTYVHTRECTYAHTYTECIMTHTNTKN